MAGAMSLGGIASHAAAPVNGFKVVSVIPLPGVTGRMDHLAFDPVDQTVFIAELGNGSVSAVDVGGRKLERRLTGLGEPQGVVYSESLKLLYVASADGKVRSYRRADLSLDKITEVGPDADNLRLDEKTQRLYVGAGKGSLVALDARTLALIARIALPGHPEGFQLVYADSRIVVNVPDAKQISILDRAQGKQVGRWPTGELQANYPMAMDAANGRAISIFRQPARIVSWDLARGTIAVNEPTCADADDVFVDARRQQIYVVCGEGAVDVLTNPTFQKVSRLPTTPGARTGLFRADADRLFVAARANGAAPAALWVLAPSP